MSDSHGAVLNLASGARDCRVNRKTAEGDLEGLEALLLGYRLNVFTKRARGEFASHPRLIYFDTGVFPANRPSGPLGSAAEIAGAALEDLVAQCLRAWCAYSGGRHELYYRQTRAKVEVDFVIYGPSGIHAIEVKNSTRVRPDELRALRSFGEDYLQRRRILLYRGMDRIKRDDVLCTPCDEFLLAPTANKIPH